MTNLAQLIDDRTTELTRAVVTATDRDGLTVEEGGMRYAASRAATCLIEPEPGDLVLLAHAGPGEAYVLAILDRKENGPARVDFADGVELGSSAGEVKLKARGPLSLSSSSRLDMVAPAVELTAAVGRMVVGRLEASGRVAQATWDRVRLRARQTESVVDNALGWFKTRLSKVEREDRTEAAVLWQELSQAHVLHTKYALTRARKDIKIKARQIMMG